MKKILVCILVVVTLLLGLTSCNKKGNEVNENNIKVEMTCKVLEIGTTLLVDVLESEYAFGNYILHINDNTVFYNKEGDKIKKGDIKVGDKIKVKYSGQVMLSIPPQVVAYEIEIL